MTTRLLVLGAVRLFQPAHGYEVRRELLSWHAHEWAQIQPGSIYNALKSLTRDGLLEVVGTDQVGSRPERTMYRLTAAGEEAFRSLLREEWWTVRPLLDPLMAAISFIGYVARDEAIAALEHRISQVHGFVKHLQFATSAIDGVVAPEHVREMHWLLGARMEAEVDWAKKLIERLRNHEYRTADDPPWQPPDVVTPADGQLHGRPRNASNGNVAAVNGKGASRSATKGNGRSVDAPTSSRADNRRSRSANDGRASRDGRKVSPRRSRRNGARSTLTR